MTGPEAVPTRTTPDQITVPPDGRPYSAQPQWRNDFPIDWPQDDLVARRDFTKFLVLTSLAFAVGQVWILFENFARRRQGRLPVARIAGGAALPVGGSLVFAYPGQHDNCILVHTRAETWRAFSQRCTHLACAVIPEPANGRFHCPCHNGSFDIETGVPTGGPPRRPLERILLELRDGELYAVGRELRA